MHKVNFVYLFVVCYALQIFGIAAVDNNVVSKNTITEEERRGSSHDDKKSKSVEPSEKAPRGAHAASSASHKHHNYYPYQPSESKYGGYDSHVAATGHGFAGPTGYEAGHASYSSGHGHGGGTGYGHGSTGTGYGGYGGGGGYSGHGGHGSTGHGVYNGFGGHGGHGYNGALALKGLLIPLAGIALLGAAAALSTNPVLLQLGVVNGRRRKRSLGSEEAENFSAHYPENPHVRPDNVQY